MALLVIAKHIGILNGYRKQPILGLVPIFPKKMGFSEKLVRDKVLANLMG
jgi:hypothetical protein